MNKITLETMLRDIGKLPFRMTAAKMKNMLTCRLSASKSLVLYLIAQGEAVNGETYRKSRMSLMRRGYIKSRISEWTGATGKPRAEYYFLPLGKEASEEIVAVYKPIARKLDQIQVLVDTLQTQGNRGIDDEQGNPTTIRNLLAIYVAKLKETGLTMADIEVFIKVKQKERQAV